MLKSSILDDITIGVYGAHTRLSGRYKYFLRFSESGRILKQPIRQTKFTPSVSYGHEIFQNSLNDTMDLTDGAAILRLED